jgi:predicted nuclease with TOPRIM domain
MYTHTQAELELERERVKALELEKEAFKEQNADLREKLVKMQTELDELKSTLENMVPRCVYVCVCVFDFDA